MTTLKKQSNYSKIPIKITKKNKNKQKIFKTILDENEYQSLIRVYFMNESFEDLKKKIATYLNILDQNLIIGKIDFLCQEFRSNNYFYDSKMTKDDILENKEFLKIKEFLKDYVVDNQNIESISSRIANLFVESKNLYHFNLASYQNNRQVQANQKQTPLYIKYDSKYIYIIFEKYRQNFHFKNIKQYLKYPKLLNNIMQFSIIKQFKSTYNSLQLPKDFYQKLKKFKINTEYPSNPIDFNLDYYCCPYLELDLEIGNLGKIENILKIKESSGCFINPELNLESILKLKSLALNLLESLSRQNRKYSILIVLPNTTTINTKIIDPLKNTSYYLQDNKFDYKSMPVCLILLSTYKSNTFSEFMEHLL